MKNLAKLLMVGACAMSLATLGAASAAHAATVPLKADLTAGAQVPPVYSPATGTFAGSLNTTTHVLTYTVTYSGLTGPASAAHFHGPAAAGANAGVAVAIKAPLASPIKGHATLTTAQEKDLLAGLYYVNIHTAANKAGEIRGQVSK